MRDFGNGLTGRGRYRTPSGEFDPLLCMAQSQVRQAEYAISSWDNSTGWAEPQPLLKEGYSRDFIADL